MHRRQDGKPLKTKIVATAGALAHEMYDPGGVESVRFGGSADDWARFLGWFERDDGHLIDVLRINMSFYQPADDGTPDPDCKELKILSLLKAQRRRFRNLAVLGDLPGPKLRLMGVGDEIELSDGQRVELMLAGDCDAPTVCAYGRPVAEEDPGITERLRGYAESEGRPIVSWGSVRALPSRACRSTSGRSARTISEPSTSCSSTRSIGTSIHGTTQARAASLRSSPSRSSGVQRTSSGRSATSKSALLNACDRGSSTSEKKDCCSRRGTSRPTSLPRSRRRTPPRTSSAFWM